MIDKTTLVAYDRAVKASRRKGTALVEELDHQGLLVTNRADHEIAHNALKALLAALDARGPESLMRMKFGRVYGSPADMYAAIMDFMTAFTASRQM